MADIAFAWQMADSQLQNRNKSATLRFTFSVYIHGIKLWAKPYGIKLSPIGNNFRNALGTWEPLGNLMGTH